VSLIKWDAKFSVGLAEIDEEHKKLFAMINSLHEAMRSGKGIEILAEILDEATSYTLKHFAHEEKLMIKYQYAGYKMHKVAHCEFIDTVTELRKQHDLKKLSALKLLQALQAWLINHINDIDKLYSPVLIKAINK